MAAVRRGHAEIVQSAEAGDEFDQFLGNRRFLDVGVVPFARDLMYVDGCAKRFLDLGGGSAEDDEVAAARHALHGEAAGFQPRGGPVDVLPAGAETLGKLLGRELVVVERRVAVLLRREQIVERLLLGG